jgi:predicted N-acetyltransferase YhbS
MMPTEAPGTLRIRDARPDERDAITAVTLAAYAQYASLMPHWEQYRRHVLTSLREDEPGALIVAERDGVIVGSVLLDPLETIGATAGANAGWPELRLLAVAPEARGQGVGRALLDECIRRARRAGVAALGLHTEDIMEVAMRMYEGSGFVRVPEVDFSPAADVLVKGYRLSLDQSTPEHTSHEEHACEQPAIT